MPVALVDASGSRSTPTSSCSPASRKRSPARRTTRRLNHAYTWGVADPDDLPTPLQGFLAAWDAFDRVRIAFLCLFILGVAVACLVVGTALARLIGLGLLSIYLIAGCRAFRRRSANRSAKPS